MSVADIFGAPRTGVHSYRLFDVAVVDLGLTVAAAFPISKYLETDFVYTAAGLVLISIPIHALFGVKTKLTEFFLYFFHLLNRSIWRTSISCSDARAGR